MKIQNSPTTPGITSVTTPVSLCPTPPCSPQQEQSFQKYYINGIIQYVTFGIVFCIIPWRLIQVVDVLRVGCFVQYWFASGTFHVLGGHVVSVHICLPQSYGVDNEPLTHLHRASGIHGGFFVFVFCFGGFLFCFVLVF